MMGKYLPVGSICILKDMQKKVMITGFCIKSGDGDDKVYDYVGCFYPEGIMNVDKNLLFDHTQIEKIINIGYINDEEKEFKKKVNELTNNNQNNLIFDESVYDMSKPVATIEVDE